MMHPRASGFSHITRAIRGESHIEIVRWYSGPRWGSTSRRYRVKPHHAQRLQVIFSGLQAQAH